jgi:hypothetical protein
MHYRHGHGPPRTRARRLLAGAAALTGAAAAAAMTMGITMSAAHAEAQSTTAHLTLTGMVDANCPIDVGGTTAYVAPGGTVTLEPSLVGASVASVPLDAAHIASFVVTVTVDGDTTTLRHPGDKLVLPDVTAVLSVEWHASAVTLLGLLSIPLNANSVSLPVGAELNWTGRIVPSADTRCGVAPALPTVQASVGTHTVTVPGIGVSVSLPGRPGTATAPSTSAGATSSSPASSSSPSTRTPTRPPGMRAPSSHHPVGSTQPSRGAIDQPPGTGPGRHRMPAVGSRDGTTRTARHDPGGPASEPAARSTRAETAVPIRGGRRTPAAEKDIAAPGTQRLAGSGLPALLAIAAVLALSVVSALGVRQYFGAGGSGRHR